MNIMKRNTKKNVTEGGNKMEGILYMTEIMKRKMMICSMAILIVCLWATASLASWSQWITENGIYGATTYNITKFEVFKLAGTSGLENPGMSNFTAGSWTVDMPNSNYVVATNTKTDISNVTWLFSFTGTSSDSLHLAYLAYTSTGQVFGSYLDFNYGGTSNWSFPMISNSPLELSQFDNTVYNRNASSVPLPPAVFLFGGGLFGLVALRKKIKA
jgi:hypothetical protein